jgi:hypothetical protein
VGAKKNLVAERRGGFLATYLAWLQYPQITTNELSGKHTGFGGMTEGAAVGMRCRIPTTAGMGGDG